MVKLIIFSDYIVSDGDEYQQFEGIDSNIGKCSRILSNYAEEYTFVFTINELTKARDNLMNYDAGKGLYDTFNMDRLVMRTIHIIM